MRLIVDLTGATSATVGVALPKALREPNGVEAHLVVSPWARTAIELARERYPAEFQLTKADIDAAHESSSIPSLRGRS